MRERHKEYYCCNVLFMLLKASSCGVVDESRASILAPIWLRLSRPGRNRQKRTEMRYVGLDPACRTPSFHFQSALLLFTTSSSILCRDWSGELGQRDIS